MMMNREEMFYKFDSLSIRLRSLSGIVQNDIDGAMNHSELSEWKELMDELVEDIHSLKKSVLKYAKDGN